VCYVVSCVCELRVIPVFFFILNVKFSLQLQVLNGVEVSNSDLKGLQDYISSLSLTNLTHLSLSRASGEILVSECERSYKWRLSSFNTRGDNIESQRS